MEKSSVKPTKVSRDRVESVERALTILQCFHSPGEILSLADLAERSQLYKSTILRLAGSLRSKGFLERRDDGRFTLGAELGRLGRLNDSKLELEALLRPILKRLTAETGETTSFFVVEGRRRLCLCRENSHRSARHHLEEGTLHPINFGATAKILKAFFTETDTKQSVEIKRLGWASSNGDNDPDLSAVAVPVTNMFGETFGALSISGLRSRFTPSRIVHARKLLLETVRHLAASLPRVQAAADHVSRIR